MPRLTSGDSPPATWCAAGPRIRRDVMIAPPLRTRITHTHYPRKIRTRITLAARWGHRALPPLHTRGVHPIPKNLCASIHPAQKLFVPLCVKTSRTRITHDHGAMRRDAWPPPPVGAPHPPGSRRHYTRALRRAHRHAPWCGLMARSHAAGRRPMK